MNCLHCNKTFSLESAITQSPFSWPLRQTIWFVCNNCNNGNHVRFENGAAQTIKLGGSPGYEYDVIETENEPSIEARVDPSYLHIWFQGKHHEITERA